MTDEEVDRILDVPFLLWFCPKGCRGGVQWHDLPGEQKQAECLACGERSRVVAAPRAARSPRTPEP